MLGNLNPQTTRNGDLATSTDCANGIFHQFSLVLFSFQFYLNKTGDKVVIMCVIT